MRILGHRGFSARAPENTLASFQLAKDAGADGVELDVTMSSDGVPVCIHDDTLERTTTGHGHVAHQPWSVLRTLDAGRWFDVKFDGEGIPTLAAVLDLMKGSEVNVEIKGGGAAPRNLVGAVLGVLAEHADPEATIISSFDPRMLRAIGKADARWKRGLLFGTKGTLARTWRIWARILGVELLHPHVSRVNAAATVRSPSAINVWTVNDPDAILELSKMGVRGIITDDPELARRTLGGANHQG